MSHDQCLKDDAYITKHSYLVVPLYMDRMSRATCHLLLLGLILFGIVSGGAASKGLSKDAKDVAKWVENARFAKQKVTHLHFFFHDTVSGEHPTALPIAKSDITDKSATAFGKLLMADDPLTLGTSINSTIIGYARGLYGSSSQSQIALVMALNLVFTDGKFKGSSLVLVGDNDAMSSPREMSISGGTGVFRLAKGVATANTYFITNLDAIVEYNVAVLHY